ncbi:TetR/AcrR family transcriptional regulator [Actinacidiphila paucisporea]|uniref:Transcriptional regulator, TetR family n=1 Tax=Actinacidiphila paucisporea TaxID=310782 RepID=A0A1M6UCP6_9ACTN|nr:TetR/AcrR family transcriptional regulator [Actinacidiphila paucisporea]SHK66956.1 transcriptional regulator, TetR family [Actinacidiphila paucisporea]
MRADAQRNYDRLLEEAKQAFIVHGTDVALEDIARHAGVGIGTLYRHFPDRYSLMNAVFIRELESLSERADDLISADDPADALFSWLRAVGAHSAMYRGLSSAILAQSDGRMLQCKAQLRQSGGALLSRAQESGAVRDGIEVSDLLKLTSALVLCAEKNPEDRKTFDRLMSLAVNGILAPREAPPA